MSDNLIMHGPDWWDRFFLGLAEYYSTASKDPSTKIGAIIVDPETRIVRGMGTNGFPRGVADLAERYENREIKYKMVVHGEINAIINSNGPVRGCTLYVVPTLMVPNICPDCCKAVINAGIKRLVGWYGETAERWQEMAHYSKTMLDEAGVKVDLIPKELH